VLDMDEALKRQCKVPVYMIGLSGLPQVVGYEPRLQRTVSGTLCVRSTGTGTENGTSRCPSHRGSTGTSLVIIFIIL
jgi:hypothetical protein